MLCLLDLTDTSVQKALAAIASAVTLVYILPFILTPRTVAEEPPLIASSIPLVGHLIGIIFNRVQHFSRIYEKTNLPAVTLPVLNKKLYIIFSPQLQQSAMRAKTMNPQSFTVNFIPPVFGIKKKTLDAMLGRDGVHESLAVPMHQVFHTALSGDSLSRLSLSTLNYAAESLNAVSKEGVEATNLYVWLRDVMTRAATDGLFGREHNPYTTDPAILEAQWDFEAYMAPLALGILPSVIARKAYQARQTVWAALEPYYLAKHDQDDGVSDFIRSRTSLWRRNDIPAQEIARNEISVMLAAGSNTVPTLFWCIANIWLRPDLLRDLREEVSAALEVPLDRTVRHGGGKEENNAVEEEAEEEISVDFTRLESRCPLLVGCYREALRLASQIITFRQVYEDTTVSDGAEGASYLLRAGSTVMMPAKVVHRDRTTWGDDPERFDPYRFVSGSAAAGGKEEEKLRKAAFVPFGGGRHLCPGRHFAAAEILGFVAVLLLGFDVKGLRGDKLKMKEALMVEAAKPAPGFEGGPVAISSRKYGWEGVRWRFSC